MVPRSGQVPHDDLDAALVQLPDRGLQVAHRFGRLDPVGDVIGADHDHRELRPATRELIELGAEVARFSADRGDVRDVDGSPRLVGDTDRELRRRGVAVAVHAVAGCRRVAEHRDPDRRATHAHTRRRPGGVVRDGRGGLGDGDAATRELGLAEEHPEQGSPTERPDGAQPAAAIRGDSGDLPGSARSAHPFSLRSRVEANVPCMRYSESLVDLIGNTPLVRLRSVTAGLAPTVLAKVEYFNPGGSVKDRIAMRMIDAAEQSGELKPGGTIVEPTSGNTGIGLALIAQQRGYHCIFVCPDKVSGDKVNTLRAYGADVVVCPTAVAPEDPRSYYSVSDRLARETPGGWKPRSVRQSQQPALALRDDRA